MEQDFLGRLRAQAQKALQMLENEIQRLEHHLADLRGKAEALGGLSGGKSAAGKRRGRPPGRPAGVASAPAARVKAAKPKGPKRPPLRTSEGYAKLLEKLPRTFTKEDLHKAAPDFAKRPKAGVMALARWSRAKQIQKVEDGKYKKL